MEEELRKILEMQGITATHSHTSSGEHILDLPNNLSLMVLVEVYDHEDGNHRTVKLCDLAETVTQWR